MEHNSSNKSSLTDDEVKERVLRGTQLAIDRLIESERKVDGYLVVEKDGKVMTIKASDIKTSSEAKDSKTT